jgi:hypothetical protein
VGISWSRGCGGGSVLRSAPLVLAVISFFSIVSRRNL